MLGRMLLAYSLEVMKIVVGLLFIVTYPLFSIMFRIKLLSLASDDRAEFIKRVEDKFKDRT